jgi:hypothetical protein
MESPVRYKKYCDFPRETPRNTLKTANSSTGSGIFLRVSANAPNPVKYTDPDGNVINLVAAGIGAGVGAGIAALNGGSGRDIAAAAAGGVVAGGLAGLTMGGSVAVGLVGGALASMAGYTASNMVSGEATTAEGLVLSGASGAAGYAAGELVSAGVNAVSNRTSATTISGRIHNNNLDTPTPAKGYTSR